MAGGVALNCVANGKILEKKIFDNIWIQPAAGDAGGSLGAALALWHLELKQERKISNNDMKGSYLGPSFSQKEIENELKNLNANFEVLGENELIEKTAESLKMVMLLDGFRVEWNLDLGLLGEDQFGDPRSPSMQKNLNLKVKYRESFRPFAPSVLREDIDKS